jgi:hypothetical protein
VSTQRIVRLLSLFALLLAAALNPTPDVQRVQHPAKYAVAFRVEQPLAANLAAHFQLETPHHRVVETHIDFAPMALPGDGRSTEADSVVTLSVREAPTESASASLDRLARFQLPPPALQA